MREALEVLKKVNEMSYFGESVNHHENRVGFVESLGQTMHKIPADVLRQASRDSQWGIKNGIHHREIVDGRTRVVNNFLETSWKSAKCEVVLDQTAMTIHGHDDCQRKATPVYLSEIAPSKWRGALNTGFTVFISVGIVAANCLNYGATRLSWGWRLSLGLAGVPAIIMTIGVLLISDTPSSLVERGKLEQAKQSLIHVRGIGTNIEPELNDLIVSSDIAKASNQEPFATIFERQYRPHLVMAIALPFFQQVTGIKIIAVYAPVLFQSVGFGHDSAFIAAIIVGLVELGFILVSSTVVDRFGRRFLFLVGGIQMFICQVAVACVLAAVVGVSSTKHISKDHGILVLVLMCLYVAGFGCSWGPLSWLVPSEIFPMKIRTTGQSISIATNFAAGFLLSQTFLTMLCHFKFGAFLFFAGWIFVMTIFVLLFLPETKGIPLNSMYVVWEGHWYWSRFVKAQSSSVMH